MSWGYDRAQDSNLIRAGESAFRKIFFPKKFPLNLGVGRLSNYASQSKKNYLKKKKRFFYVKPPKLYTAKTLCVKSKDKMGERTGRCNSDHRQRAHIPNI